MELVNIFLERGDAREGLRYVPDARLRTGFDMGFAIRYFLSVLDKHLHLAESSFYIVVRDGDLFYYICDGGAVRSVDAPNYYVFDEALPAPARKRRTRKAEPVSAAKATGPVTAVTFVINEEMPLRIRPRRGVAVKVRSNNRKYYY
ncbi:virion core protein [Eastern grey kangaroopox virus]|uniref:Virion core protein n=1 Tax=Eastern grey kangaroopox virus TaxID=2042482 RepID=A0A2C9DT14_9POXV|nr:virion core protein [Eastern grey kangaroopox virus]ATI21147.1 virion core protein [Eastern grey kangaroopox virus]ATX75054.1 virion core protein [Eastern grey kangaroopox virus]